MCPLCVVKNWPAGNARNRMTAKFGSCYFFEKILWNPDICCRTVVPTQIVTAYTSCHNNKIRIARFPVWAHSKCSAVFKGSHWKWGGALCQLGKSACFVNRAKVAFYFRNRPKRLENVGPYLDRCKRFCLILLQVYIEVGCGSVKRCWR